MKLNPRTAKLAILRAANASRVDPTVKPYTMRRIQDAVCAVRRKGLLDADILRSAGYNPA